MTESSPDAMSVSPPPMEIDGSGLNSTDESSNVTDSSPNVTSVSPPPVKFSGSPEVARELPGQLPPIYPICFFFFAASNFADIVFLLC